MNQAEPTSQDTILKVENLRKAYVKNIMVNDNINLSLGRGEVYGLLGPNGAGKTTLVSQIIGLVKPDAGSIVINGVNVVANPGYARQACSFQAQTQVPINGLTTKQAIELVGRIRGGDVRIVRQEARELLAYLEMQEWENKPAESLSGGMRRLVAFCMAVVVPGQIVILDEPTNDVDPLRRRLLWDEVRSVVNRGSTVLLVTHNVLEAERAVDRLAVINRGRVIAAGTPATLKENGGHNMRLEMTLEPRTEQPSFPDFLHHPVVTGRRIMARLAGGDVAAALLWAKGLKDRGGVEEYSIGPVTLEDAYLKIIGHEEMTGEGETNVKLAA